MSMRLFRTISIFGLLLVLPINAMSEYLFTAPPRESAEKGEAIYRPIAEFLTKATGEAFVYRQPSDWTEYSRGMQNLEYDLVFDGPHFVSWRVKHIKHDLVVKLPQLHIWRIITRKDAGFINSIDDLIGKKICAPKSPNFGMLTMYSHFPNPDKEPIHVVTKGWKDGFDSVIQGKCVAAVLPKTNHKKFDPKFTKTKALHTHLPYPNQAFTVAPSISPGLKSSIVKGLLSRDGQAAMYKLRERFTRGAELVSAQNEEYEGISMVLKRASNFSSAVNK